MSAQSEVIKIDIPIAEIESHYKRNPDLILVHLNKDEAKMLDEMQGGFYTDETFGIRDYSRLSDILANKDARTYMLNLLADMSDGKISPENKSVHDQFKHPEGTFHKAPGDDDPYVEDIAEEGNQGDTEVVLMPIDFADFWDMCRGYTSTNRKTGLREYIGWNPVRAVTNVIKAATSVVAKPVNELVGRPLGHKNLGNEMIRVAAPVVGYTFGGPMGAALGSTLAHIGTGNDLMNSAMHGLKSYGIAAAADWAAPGIGSALNSAVPWGSVGAAGSAPVYSGGKMIAGSGQALPGASKAAAAGAQGASKAAAESSGMLSSLSNLATSPGGLLALAGGATYLGAKRAKKDRDRARDDAKDMMDSERKRAGLTGGLRDHMNEYYMPNYESYGIEQGAPDVELKRSYQVYKKGGKVNPKKEDLIGKLSNLVTHSEYYDGPGKGQDDLIRKDPPEGSYIWDASVTSMLGDGSSKAGASLLREFENTVLKKYKGPHIKAPLKKVPALVSDGEYQSSPLMVTLLGGGSNEKGSHFLKKTIENIRRHKSMNKGGLPPKAKPLSQYFPCKPKILKAGS